MLSETPPAFWSSSPAKEDTAPPPVKPGPVLIHDAITPVGGETLLLALLRRAHNADQP